MTSVSIPARRIPVAGEYDVVVAGGGPAGFAAAVCAARQGAKTLLIEQAGQVGGVATTGLMSHWTGRTKGGFYEELLERSCVPGAHRTTIDPERLKGVMLEMLEEAGAEVLLYAFCAEALMENGRVAGVITQSKSGLQAWRAKVVIDASGDGAVAASAGAAFVKGREGDGKMQPMTLMFKVGGVDVERAIFPGSFETRVKVPLGEIQALARERLPHPAGHVLLYRTSLPGVVTCNMTNVIDVDGTRAEDLTRAECVCRKQMPRIVEFLRACAPGYEGCYLLSSASIIGVRETRHFKGLHTLTEEDILAARVFPDWVVTKAHFNFDIHSLKGPGLDEHGVQNEFKQPEGYTIPYGCLVPEKVDGLLLAGRCISGTHKAHSNYRVMPICANMGQAAGIAAALAAAKNLQPREVPAAEIQTILRGQGVEP